MLPQAVRIACLVPSLTETLFDLGLGEQLVARTGYCIHPAGCVSAVPKVGGTKTVNLKKLAQLRPTHVLLNRDENTLDTLAAVQAFNPSPRIVASHPQTPFDNCAVFRELGDVFGVQTAAARLCERFETQIAHVQAQAWPSRRVLYLIWQDPWMTVASNTYISQTLALFGVQTVPAVQAAWVGGSRYPVLADVADTIRAQGVEAVLLSTEPYAFNAAHCEALRLQLGVPVYLVDGEMTSWYGSRALSALPTLTSYFKGLGWA